MNIFGSVHLGYVVVDTEKFADWRRFGRDAIGMHLDEASPDVLRFRLDDHVCRFLVQRGAAEDVAEHGGPRRLHHRGSRIGHVAVTSTKPHQVRGYYDSVFDARLTDYIDETIGGLKFKIRFLRVNQRHHSIAIAAVNRLPINTIRTRVHTSTSRSPTSTI